MTITMPAGSNVQSRSARWRTHPALDDVRRIARSHPETKVIPIFRETMADLETPVSAFLKVRGTGPAFLLESIEGGERLARYSFIGGDPLAVLTMKGGTGEVATDSGEVRRLSYSDPLLPLAELLAGYRSPVLPELPLPRFSGGAVGYLAYEAVRAFEPRVPAAAGPGLDLPDGVWMLVDSLLVFDHLARTIKAVAHVRLDEVDAIEVAYAQAEQRINILIDKLNRPLNGGAVTGYQ